ncbi:2-oxo-4-hydroxy-4-carboxy--5-ureidoimidazoline (OHCU) decarboxylase [Kineosphaera limosa]|uniref:hypothetical protein n=1 Tax=Kineosphaera limosa TaxID=111564 RepID=UPI000305C26A|nr:hypothetical protein [Kineosphaera limosa]NYD99505.1 2-oxo-4-hydroxy-4-carboxy--5-ureidoimidazoline (OHCU) decarboxylase [Kineosphaera limosa]
MAGEPGKLVRLGQVNDMTREQFVDTFGGLFQGPRWAVERAYDSRPFEDTMGVRDRDSYDDLVKHGWERVDNSAAHERATALVEIAKIAGYRFDDLVAEANPIHSARTRFVRGTD